MSTTLIARPLGTSIDQRARNARVAARRERLAATVDAEAAAEYAETTIAELRGLAGDPVVADAMAFDGTCALNDPVVW